MMIFNAFVFIEFHCIIQINDVKHDFTILWDYTKENQ